MTKLCTCRSAAEGLPVRVRACVCVRSLFLVPLPHCPVQFWRGQDTNVTRGSVLMDKRAPFRGHAHARGGPTSSFASPSGHTHPRTRTPVTAAPPGSISVRRHRPSISRLLSLSPSCTHAARAGGMCTEMQQRSATYCLCSIKVVISVRGCALKSGQMRELEPA